MKIKLNIEGGLLPYAVNKEMTFSLDDLPGNLQEKVKSRFSRNYLSSTEFSPENLEAADTRQIKVRLQEDDDNAFDVSLDEASCPADFLDLIDDISRELQTKKD